MHQPQEIEPKASAIDALPSRPTADELLGLLRGLYTAQLAHQDDPYLAAHSRTRAALWRQVEVVLRYEPYVQGRILDWGCRHAPDACLLRALRGAEIELVGADFAPPHTWERFHTFAQLDYVQLDHPSELPFAAESFDVVLSSGVLEHVPHDYESLKEIWRILRPEGRLILTFLPNCWSYTEFLGRCAGVTNHVRRYRRREVQRQLLHTGFVVLEAGYHQILPSLAGLGAHCSAATSATFADIKPAGTRPAARRVAACVDGLWKVQPLLERLWPLNRFSSNLFIVAQKRLSM